MTDIERKTRRFEDDNQTQSYPHREQEYKECYSEREVKYTLDDSSPGSNTYGAYFDEWYATNEINMGIIL